MCGLWRGGGSERKLDYPMLALVGRTHPAGPAPMTNRPTPRRVVKCPGCAGPSVYAPANPYRPFCSQRCKNNDFGAWASESYSVPATPALGDDATDQPPDPDKP